MKIEVNITKRKFWALVTMFILVVGVFVLAAKPTPVGHSVNEIEGLSELQKKVDELAAKSEWPSGEYCVWKKGTCPAGFKEAGLSIDGEDSGKDDWGSGGPIGDSFSDSEVNYQIRACCK